MRMYPMQRKDAFRSAPVAGLVVVLATPALVPGSHTFAAQSHLDGVSETGVAVEETSDTGSVSHSGDGIDAWASARDLALRARCSAYSAAPVHRHCNVLTTFSNTARIEPGSSGRAVGDPVTLALTVSLHGSLIADYEGPTTPHLQPRSFLGSAGVTAWVEVTVPERRVCVPDDGDLSCRPAEIGGFDAQATRREEGSPPGYYYPNGALLVSSDWFWEMTSNRGETFGNEDSSRSQICDWPVHLPCVITEPLPPPPPDYRGTRTILVDAFVGDLLQVDGLLSILPQATHANASAGFPAAPGTVGLGAALAPAPGFEGLVLTYALGGTRSLSVDDASASEGDAGTTLVSFPVRLSSASAEPVTVAYAIQDGTATQPDDYLATAGTLTFAPGVLQQTIAVEVAGDLRDEPDETFQVVLADAAGASVGDGVGQGTIVDDDAAPPACDPVAASTAEDVPLEGVLACSSQSPSLTYALAGAPVHGEVEVTDGGHYTYVPPPDWNGQDSFTVTATDAAGSSSGPVTVTVTVEPVNDRPVCQPLGLEASVGTTAQLPPECSDVDGDALTIAITSQGTLGTATADGQVLGYTPTAAGTDAFAYAASDGTLVGDPAVVTVTTRAAAALTIGNAVVVFRTPPDDDRARFAGRLPAPGPALSCPSDVTVTLNDTVFAETIPAAAFQVRAGGKRCLYVRTGGGAGGGIKRLDLNFATGTFYVSLRDEVELSALADPVTLGIDVGAVGARQTVDMRQARTRWTYRR